MSIQYDTVIEVLGKYVSGEIRDGKYITDEIIKLSKKRLTSKDINSIIQELKELEELLVAHETIDILSSDEKDRHETLDDFENTFYISKYLEDK